MTSQTPIFETLAPGEVFILYIIDDGIEYISNVDGVPVFATVKKAGN
jgi:hypothetical protein